MTGNRSVWYLRSKTGQSLNLSIYVKGYPEEFRFHMTMFADNVKLIRKVVK